MRANPEDRAEPAFDQPDPDTAQLVRCERCERYVVPTDGDGDDLCPHCGLVL